MNGRPSELTTLNAPHVPCREQAIFRSSVETKLGEITLYWAESGLLRLCLPGDASRAEGLLDAEQAGLPEWGRAIGEQLSLLAKGQAADFSEVPLDLSALTPFQREVLEACAQIRWGEVLTYGELARRTGRETTAARAVGKALSINPVPLVVPCHRVLGASGKLTGFSAPGGLATKEQLLALEGALPVSG